MRGYLDAWRTLPRGQRILLAILAAVLAAANIYQPFPAMAPLQHLPTVLLLIAAPPLLRRFPITDRALTALVGFFLLHTLAGRYTYSNVPYDRWAEALFGRDITHMFGLRRNGFDRLVHLSFGLLWIAPMSEIIERHGGLSRRASVWTAFLFIGAFSAAYEVFEWLLAMIAAPDLAADYNGQQGDPWDSQKDMAMAMLGGLVSALLTLRRPRSD